MTAQEISSRASALGNAARVLSSELSTCAAGDVVHLAGWVHRVRDFGGVRFLILRDRGGLAQVVVGKEIDLHAAGCESVVRVEGTVHPEARAPGGMEVRARLVEVVSPAEPPPFEVYAPKVAEHQRLETMLEHRAVSLRVPEVTEVFRVQAEILRAFRATLGSRGFTEVCTPKLVLAGAEGGSALFEVAYYGGKAYLAQSPQFYKQMLVGSGLERVFEVGHAYRAEKSETARHLTEFVSLDFEMGFISGIEELMGTLEAFVTAAVDGVREKFAPALKRRKLNLGLAGTIPRIDFPEAVDILRREFGKTAGLEGDLDTEGERLLGQHVRETLGSDFVFVTGYALSHRPAYAQPHPTEPARSASFDLLCRGVEISTGGQRIHSHPQLAASFRARGLSPNEDYFAAFKHGMPPHGGAGVGLERFTKQLLNLANVKEACLFPRDPGRLRP